MPTAKKPKKTAAEVLRDPDEIFRAAARAVRKAVAANARKPKPAAKRKRSA
jgi:hypothetical protein